jgi:outer membrane protein assembly factor BamB
MAGLPNDFTKPLVEIIVQTVKNVGDAIASTGDRLLIIPIGAVGSYSNGKVSTCGDRGEVVTEVHRRACRLLHGSYSWLATAAANTLSLGQSTPIQHEWIEIKTNTHYYIVQIWVNGDILMERKNSRQEIDQAGLYCANRPSNADVWTVDVHSLSIELGDIIDWLKSEQFTPSYHWSKHNCQHFCQAFMNRFFSLTLYNE